jgi:hypothetical protein
VNLLQPVVPDHEFEVLNSYNGCNIEELGMIEYIFGTIRGWFQDSVENKCFDCSSVTAEASLFS